MVPDAATNHGVVKLVTGELRVTRRLWLGLRCRRDLALAWLLLLVTFLRGLLRPTAPRWGGPRRTGPWEAWDIVTVEWDWRTGNS